MRRTDIFTLALTEEQERVLTSLADNCSKMWNKLNYRRRQSFFNGVFDWNSDREYHSVFKTTNGKHVSKRLRLLFRKRQRRFKHAMNAVFKHLVEVLWKCGVSVIYVGDLNGIRENNNKEKIVNQKIHNFWSFRYVIKKLREKAEEYGIKVLEIHEWKTSIKCPRRRYENNRNRRFIGLFKCLKCSYTNNTDIVGALNLSKVAVKGSKPSSGSRLVAQPLVLRWNYHTWEPRISRL